MREVSTSVRIDAPVAAVWSVLTDLHTYPAWNPFIRSVSGDLRTGEKLRVVIGADGASPQTFTPTVQAVVNGRSFSWLGALPVPGLFSGRHAFDLRADVDATELKQHEQFSGLLVPFFAKMLRETENGFNSMNLAVKARVEARA